MDKQTIAKICEEYADKSIKTHDICARYGLKTNELATLIIAEGLKPRRPNRVGKKIGYVKKCPNCKKTVDVKGARYCPYCATDIRDERDILIEQIEGLFGLFQLLPANVCDRAQQTILATLTYLKKEKNNENRI